MLLKLRPNHIQVIQSHAEGTYPEECCGLLLGKLSVEEKLLVEVRSLENTWSPEIIDDPAPESTKTKQQRYTIAPDVMLREMRYARARNLQVIGIYHSHPDHPAMPSECDRRNAWSLYSYIIVSVQQGKAQDWQNWVLDTHHQFQPEDFSVTDEIARMCH